MKAKKNRFIFFISICMVTLLSFSPNQIKADPPADNEEELPIGCTYNCWYEITEFCPYYSELVPNSKWKVGGAECDL